MAKKIPKRQLEVLRQDGSAREKWIRKMIREDLKGSQKKEVVEFLKKLIDDAKSDTSVYRIQIFAPAEFYDQLLCEICEDILPAINGVTLESDERLHFIQLNFNSMDALESFRKHPPIELRYPLRSQEGDVSYEFIEWTRNSKDGRWEIATEPVLWNFD